MGMNPQATYHGGDFDFVDMSTGRLNLHIPLVVDHSQRGKLNFTYSVEFSSTGTWSYLINKFGYQVEPPKHGVSSPVLVANGQLFSVIQQVYGDPDSLLHSYAYLASEWGYADGPAHIMGTTNCPTPCGNRVNNPTMESIDGSGVLSHSGILTNRDGLQFSLPGLSGFITDDNGNTITSSMVNAYISQSTDTLGRTWTTTVLLPTNLDSQGLVF